ncbi:oxygen-dependent choline dehydrogenase isoform X2 [Folsomia candida]|uniref:oxygen-dependent choline dehydrogenase isoform X2 n=1 Tax=Folsomia candida TaxID=158441 RepID=UPI001604CA1D|nr:oxygen-dependent choline dehydrogenase isoform X2 [Folsomia candida]
MADTSPIGKIVYNILNTPIPSSLIYPLVAFVTTLLSRANYISDLVLRPNLSVSETYAHAYDFIIVGGGTAGAVIANRLSANSEWKVLLLEAGTDPLILNALPALASANLYHKDTDWNYFSVPQKNHSYASLNQKLGLSRGKSLGGCSNLNFLIYQRGNPQDYDNWANITGDKAWEYKNVLKYFKISEDYRGNFPDPLEKYHGLHGPLSVSKQGHSVLVNEWISAAKEFGFESSDPNGRQTSTFAPVDFTVNHGKRASTYHAFLKEAMPRTNLKIMRYSTVDKITMSGKKAVGVIYTRHGRKFEVRVKKEVILCAGVFGSPSILQRSGIGPKNLLESLNIPVVHDLPGVGQGLQDHVMTMVGPVLLNDSVSILVDKKSNPLSLIEYVLKRTGPLAYNPASVVGFFSTSQPKDPSWPNAAVYMNPFGIHKSYAADIGTSFALKKGILEPYIRGLEDKHALTVLMSLGRPESRGSVKIKSSDPDVPPDIDPNYYSDEGGKDIRAMIEG